MQSLFFLNLLMPIHAIMSTMNAEDNYEAYQTCKSSV